MDIREGNKVLQWLLLMLKWTTELAMRVILSLWGRPLPMEMTIFWTNDPRFDMKNPVEDERSKLLTHLSYNFNIT